MDIGHELRVKNRKKLMGSTMLNSHRLSVLAFVDHQSKQVDNKQRPIKSFVFRLSESVIDR